MLNDDKIQQSERRGSVHYIEVADQYVIVDDVIVPNKGPEAPDYPEWPAMPEKWMESEQKNDNSFLPFAETRLPLEMAKLANQDNQAILAFVGKRGLLGHQRLVDEDIADHHEALLYKAKHGGDPIDWVRHHAGTVKMVLGILESRQRSLEMGNPDILWQRLLESCWPYAGPGSLVGCQYSVGWHIEQQSFFLGGDRSTADEVAARLLVSILRPNIKYLELSLIAQEDGGVLRSISFPCLLPVIYSLLADAAVGDRLYVKCAGCGDFFLQEDKRQRYCRHPTDPEGSESLCALKARQTRFQSKRKREER